MLGLIVLRERYFLAGAGSRILVAKVGACNGSKFITEMWIGGVTLDRREEHESSSGLCVENGEVACTFCFSLAALVGRYSNVTLSYPILGHILVNGIMIGTKESVSEASALVMLVLWVVGCGPSGTQREHALFYCTCFEACDLRRICIFNLFKPFHTLPSFKILELYLSWRAFTIIDSEIYAFRN
eukprot:1154924-Pelagomonas_calceolata.AAC.1